MMTRDEALNVFENLPIDIRSGINFQMIKELGIETKESVGTDLFSSQEKMNDKVIDIMRRRGLLPT